MKDLVRRALISILISRYGSRNGVQSFQCYTTEINSTKVLRDHNINFSLYSLNDTHPALWFKRASRGLDIFM
jgi:hypothetical protein